MGQGERRLVKGVLEEKKGLCRETEVGNKELVCCVAMTSERERRVGSE